jgi:hypothetical protein
MESRSRLLLATVRELIKDPTYPSYAEINRAYREIGRLTHWNFLRASSTALLSLTGSVASYPLDMSAMRRLTAIRIKKTTAQQQWVLLKEFDTRGLFEANVRDNRRSDGTDDEKQPEGYYIEGGPGATVLVSPTPDAAYTVRVEYIAKLARIDLDVEPQTPEDYDDVVANLAAGFILEGKLEPGKSAEEQNNLILAERYMQRARNEFDNLVGDVHPNRTENIDRVPQTWLR